MSIPQELFPFPSTKSLTASYIGLGWFIETNLGTEVIQHGGGIDGYSNPYWIQSNEARRNSNLMQLRWQGYTFAHIRIMAKFAVPVVGLPGVNPAKFQTN